MDSRFNFRGSGKQGTCFQICLKQLRKALEIQGAISDFNLFWTAVNPGFISEAAKTFGSSTIVVSIDVKKDLFGRYEVFALGGRKNTSKIPKDYALEMERRGAGEIFLNAIDRDGVMKGYDLSLIRSVSEAVEIPVIACGGAGKIEDLGTAVNEGGASAVSAGSLFVFWGRQKGILINFPSDEELLTVFSQ